MANQIKGITVEIGGNTQPLQKSLEAVNKNAKNLSSELRVIDKLLKLDPSNTTLLAQKQKVLADAIDSTSEKLEILTTAQKQAQEQLERGDIGEAQYRELERQVIQTRESLGKLQDQAMSLEYSMAGMGEESNQTADDVEEVGDAAEKSEKQLKTLTAGGVALGTLLGNLATKLVGFSGRAATFLLDAVEASAEFRSDLSKLQQNATAAGTSLDNVSGDLEYFIALTNETDSSVEALSNLLQAGFTDETLTNAVNNLSGAVIKFPDTLKIESLADSLQETLATGEATGQYGELLERLGVNLDDFESGLKKCTTATEKQEYAVDVLAKNGLTNLNEEYKIANRELIEYSTAQTKYNQALAKIGTAMQPVSTAITGIKTTLLNGMLPAIENVGDSLNKKLASPSVQQDIEKLGKSLGDAAEVLADFVMFLIENGDTIIMIIGSIAAGFAAWKITGILTSATKAVIEFVSNLKNGLSAINAANLSNIIGVLTTIGSLLFGLISSISKASAEMEGLKEDAEALKTTAEDLSLDFEKTNQEFIINSQRADELATSIQDLDNQIRSGRLSTGDLAIAQADLSRKTAQYNAIMGDTVLTIDKETGAIDGGTEALKQHTQKLIENAKAQAYVEKYAEAVKTASEAEVTMAATIAEMRDEYDNLTTTQQKLMDKMIAGTATQEEVSRLWHSTSIIGEKHNAEIMAGVEAWEDANAAREAAIQSMANYEEAAAAEGISLAANTEAIDQQTQAVYNLSEQEAQLLMQRLANNETISSADQAALEAWKANNAAYAEAYEEELAKQQEYQQRRIDILTNANDAINYDNQLSLQEQLNNYDNNAQKMLEYENGLASLRERAMNESNETVRNAMLTYLDYLGDYSEESMGIVHQLITGYGEGGGDMFTALSERYTAALGSEAPKIMSQTDDTFSEVGTQADESVSGSIDEATGATDSAKTKIKDMASAMDAEVKNQDNFYTIGKDIIYQIKNGMLTAENSLYSVASRIAREMKNRMTIRGTVSATGNGSTAKINVNWYAQGGIFNIPSIIGVGEAGPEAVIPLDKLEGIISNTLSNSRTISFQPVIHFTAQRVTDAEALRLSKIIGREFARATGGRMS